MALHEGHLPACGTGAGALDATSGLAVTRAMPALPRIALSLPGRRLTGELLWLGLGHVGIALSGIATVRILTGVLSPAEYGALTLLLGVAALSMSIGVTPFIQASMRFFPEAAMRGQIGAMRRVAMSWLAPILATACLVFVVVGYAIGEQPSIPIWTGFLLGLLLIGDTQRVYETSLLNSARRQRPMMAWRLSEALARPLLALTTITLFGGGAWQALLGYALATLVVNAVFCVGLRREGVALGERGERPDCSVARETMPLDDLHRGVRRYALPLVPTGLVGWINGVGDRYILAALLTVEATGLYAAVYAITSRPYMALIAFQDALFRPRLYHAVTERDEARARHIVLAWVATSGLIGGAGVILATVAHDLVAGLLLGARFREASALMPLIAVGYHIVAAQAPFGRYLHALYRTDYTLAVQLLTVVCGIASTAAGIWIFGIFGAAVAVPIYFGFKFAATLYFLHRAQTKGRARSVPADAGSLPRSVDPLPSRARP